MTVAVEPKWLRIANESFSPIEIETSLKRPLFAASFRLGITQRADGIHAKAEADAKVPLKSAWRFALESSRTNRGDEQPVDFNHSRELDVKPDRVREWHFLEGRLSFRETVGQHVTNEREVAVSEETVPVTTPLLVLAALAASFDDSCEMYGTTLVTGSKFTCLRLERVASSKRDGDELVDFRGRVISSATALDRASWLALPWNTGREFSMRFDAKERRVRKVGADLPLVGRCEISL